MWNLWKVIYNVEYKKSAHEGSYRQVFCNSFYGFNLCTFIFMREREWIPAVLPCRTLLTILFSGQSSRMLYTDILIVFMKIQGGVGYNLWKHIDRWEANKHFLMKASWQVRSRMNVSTRGVEGSSLQPLTTGTTAESTQERNLMCALLKLVDWTFYLF